MGAGMSIGAVEMIVGNCVVLKNGDPVRDPMGWIRKFPTEQDALQWLNLLPANGGCASGEYAIARVTHVFNADGKP
jgi:hypothetical protein